MGTENVSKKKTNEILLGIIKKEVNIEDRLLLKSRAEQKKKIRKTQKQIEYS